MGVTPWRIVAGVAAALVALVVLAGVGTWLSDPFGWRKAQLAAAQRAAVVATGQATVAQGQAGLQSDQSAIADKGGQRDRQVIIIREGNRDAIRTAPGATVRLDPELNARGRRGLCNYPAYAGNSGCAQMLDGDSSLIPPASAPRAATTP